MALYALYYEILSLIINWKQLKEKIYCLFYLFYLRVYIILRYEQDRQVMDDV